MDRTFAQLGVDDAALRQICQDVVDGRETDLAGLSARVVLGDRGYQLYPDQRETYLEALAALDRWRAVILQMSTGAGKTVIAAALIRHHLELGQRVIFSAPRAALVDQTSDKLSRYGITHGFIVGGRQQRRDVRCWVATTQAFGRREVPDVDLVVVDECHGGANAILGWASQRPRAKLLGLTATPEKGNGGGLGAPWEQIIHGAPYSRLVTVNRVVPARVKAPFLPVIHGAKMIGDDITDAAAAALISGKIIRDVVGHWKSLAFGRKTALFASTIEHAEEIAQAFRDANVRAQAVHTGMPSAGQARERASRMLENGDLEVLCSVGMIGLGWDLPTLECVVMARTTLSSALFRQQAGRGSRWAPNKTHYLLLDFAGNCLLHGSPNRDKTYRLDTAPIVPRERKSSRASMVICRACLYAFERPAGRGPAECPECHAVSKRIVKYKNGMLVDYDDDQLDRVSAALEVVKDAHILRQRLYALRPFSPKLRFSSIEAVLKSYLREAAARPVDFQEWLVVNGYQRMRR